MDGLELRIGSQRGIVTEAAYRGLLDEVHGLLREVDAARLKLGPGAWGIRHRVDDNGLTVRFEPFAPLANGEGLRTLVQDVVGGVSQLAERPSIPPAYTDSAVERLSNAARRRGSGGVESLTLAAMNGQVLSAAEVTDAVAQNAAESVLPATKDLGGFEGVLDTLAGAAREPRKRRVVLVDQGTRQRVRVQFAEQHHLDTLTNAWGRRVAVHGEVTYNKAGQPIHVTATDVQVLPVPGDRGDLVRLVGIAPDWTGDRSVQDVMDDMRRRA